MSAAIREKIEGLRLAHYICEGDCWFSCPKSGECCDDSQTGCNCGADEHNAIIDEILKELHDV